MADVQFQEASRAQQSFLAPLERHALIWLAQRTPSWINPDHLTVLGLVSMLGAGLSYWNARHHKAGLIAAIFFLVPKWLGDSLDGTLARARNTQRPRYGSYVDHIIDALGTFFLLAGIGFSGNMSERIAAGRFIVYFMLSIEVYLATYTLGSFHPIFLEVQPHRAALVAPRRQHRLAEPSHGPDFRAPLPPIRRGRNGGLHRHEPDAHCDGDPAHRGSIPD